MKRLLLTACSILVLAVAAPATAGQPKTPADGLKMAKGKQPVVFNHSTHKDIKCGECHHPVNGKESYLPCGSSGCHDSMDRKDKSPRGYYHAIHSKNLKFMNCMTCHQSVAAKQPEKKKEMTSCKGSKCHM